MRIHEYLRLRRQYLVVAIAVLAAAVAVYAFYQWGQSTQLRFEEPHNIAVQAVDRMWISSRGKLVVVSELSPGSVVTVADPAHGNILEGRRSAIPPWMLAVSDDGRECATANAPEEVVGRTCNVRDELIQVAGRPDTSSGVIIGPSGELRIVDVIGTRLRSAQFVHAGELLAWVVPESGYAAVFDGTVWPGPTRDLHWNNTLGEPTSVALSDNGRLAVGTSEGGVIFLDRGLTSTEVGQATAPGKIRAIAFLDRDNVLVTGDFNEMTVVTRPGGTPAPALSQIATGAHAQKLAVGRGYVAYTTVAGVTVSRVSRETTVTPWGWTTLALAILFLLSGVTAAMFLSPAQAAAASVGITVLEQEMPAEPKSSAPPPVVFPTPQPAPELIAALQQEECVVYAGPAVSIEGDMPPGKSLAQQLLREAKKRNVLTPATATALTELLERNADIDGVVDAAVAALSATKQPLVDLLPRPKKGPQRRIHSVLAKLPFAGYLTSNFDDFLERSMDRVEVCHAADAERLMDLVARRRKFILKLQGSLSKPKTLTVGRTDFEAELGRNVSFMEVLSNLFLSRTFLFLGTSLEVVERFVSAIRGTTSARVHFAIVRVSDESWRARAEVLQRRFNITTLPYTDRTSLLAFLELLRERSDSSSVSVRTDSSSRALRIKKVEMQNIGPFARLEVPFDDKWTVLLGDNGVGKSNILRALGIVLCGRDAAPFASRIVRAGATHAAITLHTERDVYVAELRMRGDGTAEINAGVRPFDAEGFLALGFPPLRTVTWNRGVSRSELRPRPTVDDVLPIVRGEPDPRVDELKSWILEQRTRSLQEQERGATKANRYENLLTRFFEVIADVTPGLNIRLIDADVKTKEVMVDVEGDRIPIEAVSQGTISLMGWIGVMMQRMFEVHGDAPGDPLLEPAIVMIDEIDAHMHPGWQKRLAPLLTDKFKNVQFIASTHSPLIVSELNSNQVLVFGRHRGTLTMERPQFDITTLRADQLLTSLFRLDYTRNSRIEEQLKTYYEMLLLPPAKRDEAKFEELRQRLAGALGTAEDPAERGVEKIVRDTVLQLRDRMASEAIIKTDTVPPDMTEEIKRKLNQLFSPGDGK